MDRQRRRIVCGAWAKYMHGVRPIRTFGVVEATVLEASECRTGAHRYTFFPNNLTSMENWKI
jgi:hypothetical protein